jgi:hypothetical protein
VPETQDSGIETVCSTFSRRAESQSTPRSLDAQAGFGQAGHGGRVQKELAMKQITTVVQVIQTVEFDETQTTAQAVLNTIEDATRIAAADIILPNLNRVELEVIAEQNPTVVSI